jgi:hypothetical protein
MRLVGVVLLVLGLVPRPSDAQVLSDPDRGAITVLLPQEWTGAGARAADDDGGITFTGETVMVEGLATHRSGIVRVTVDGNPAIVLRDPSGATRFRTRLPPPPPGRAVEIVAYPVEGAPFVRVQFRDGTYRMAALATPPAPGSPSSVGAGHVLRVTLADADAEAGLHGSLASLRGIAVVAADAHVTVAREGGEYQVRGRDGSVRHRVSDPASLPRVLEQEHMALQFAELAAPWNGFAVDFAFASGERVFPLGAGIEFTVRSERDGYLTVVDLGTDGTVGLLYPVLNDDPQIHAGQEVRLPGTALRTFFAPDPPYRATAPVGPGVVRAFVTPRLLRLPQDATPSAAELLHALDEATAGPEPWSAAALGYRVVP